MKIKTYSVIFAVLLFFTYLGISSCERDDICAEGTPTTPLLIIQFFDFETGLERTTPPELQVTVDGIEEEFELGELTDSISIPLRNSVSITEYNFTINSNTENNDEDSDPPNTDKISFQYNTEQEYVSSACGFKVNYRALTNSPVDGQDDGLWIRNIELQTEEVIDETTTHVFIFL